MIPPKPIGTVPNHPTSGPFATLAIFSLVGPLLGALPLALIFAIGAVLNEGGFGIAVMTLLFAYPFGLVPALFAGVFYLGLRHFTHKPSAPATLRANAMQGMLAGAAGALSFVTLLYSAGLDKDSFGEHLYSTASIVLFPGLLAGSLCGLLTRAGLRQRLRCWF